MNKYIKIGLISIVVVIIGIVIWRTLIMPPELKSVEISDSYFSAYVKKTAEAKIDSSRQFQVAMQTYNQLYEEVSDASYLGNIDNAEFKNCAKLLAYHFAPRLIAYADTCFARHQWNATELDGLKASAQSIISQNNLPSDSQDLPKLRTLVSTVNDYHSALAATHCGTCTSQQQVNAIISRANSFKRAPLNNCTSLMSALDAVGAQARASLNSYNQRVAAENARRAEARNAEMNRQMEEVEKNSSSQGSSQTEYDDYSL